MLPIIIQHHSSKQLEVTKFKSKLERGNLNTPQYSPTVPTVGMESAGNNREFFQLSTGNSRFGVINSNM